MIDAKYRSFPAMNFAEVTLIGTNAYGESLVIHCGNNDWIIIDSCINPNVEDLPLPLLYLQDIGVSFESIKLIICTHWHDDHIKGIAKIFRSATNANFCISISSDKEKFMTLISFDASKPIHKSTKEFAECLAILKSRGKYPTYAIENRIVFSNKYSKIHCLSPSDYTCQRFNYEIASILQEYSSLNKKIPYQSPNAKSIVTLLEFGSHSALMGADLEISENEHEGWKKILTNPEISGKKSSLFKIPHHGSINGYHEDIWKNLLTDNPVSKLTSWCRGKYLLPEGKMINKYKQHTSKLFITEYNLSNKQKKRPPQLEKLVKEFRPNIIELKYKLGIVRSRINLEKVDDN